MLEKTLELGTIEHEETQSATCPTNLFLCNNCLNFVYMALNYKATLKLAKKVLLIFDLDF